MNSSVSPSHAWKFFTAGGVNQVAFRNGADLTSLEQLDLKLWVALAVPTRGIEFDTKTLDLIDTDKDGRIRPPELLAAVQSAVATRVNPDDLFKGGSSVTLSAIKDEAIVTAARRILASLGKPDAETISLADVADTAKIFAATPFNGDGVVPTESAGDEATKKLIEEIISTVGGLPDRSGKPGINQAKVDQFFAEAQAFSDWSAKAEADAGTLLPLGEATAGAAAAIKTLKVKADDYFARCKLAAFDSRAPVAAHRGRESRVARRGGKSLRQRRRPAARIREEDADRPRLGCAAIHARAAQRVGRCEARHECRKAGTRPTARVAGWRCEGPAHRAHRAGRRARRRVQADWRGRKAPALPARPGAVVEQLCELRRVLRPARLHLSSRLTLPRRAHLPPVHRGRGRRQARGARRYGRRVSRLLRGDPPRRREENHRGRLHRWRLGQPHRRPQRRVLRPQGFGLGRDDHQDCRQPDQHPRSILVALQKNSFAW